MATENCTLFGETSLAAHQKPAVSHPVLDRTERVLGRFPATVQQSGLACQAFRRAVLSTEAPSLHRHYSASSLLWASLPPCRPKLALASSRLARARHRQGFPVLLLSPSFVHATVDTPAETPGARVARFPVAGSLPRNNGGAASALIFSRPAQRSLHVVVCTLAEPPKAVLLHRSASVRVVTSSNRPDCYRLERQLPGGFRIRQESAPFHGARQYVTYNPNQ